MIVSETFFSIGVVDMPRATAFYVGALGAKVLYAAENWTSLQIAGVRLGLALDPAHAPVSSGLHFAVADLEGARADVARAGGGAAAFPVEVAPGVVVADVTDTEGNTFTLSLRAAASRQPDGS